MSAIRHVQFCQRRPHRCAAIPFIGQTHPKGFFDTGTEFFGERVYISVVAAEEMARALGWASPAEARAMRMRHQDLEERHAAALEELKIARRAVDAITTAKAPRRKKEEVAAA